MNTALLKRRSMPDVDPADLMTEEVLDYAHQKLGYHHPQEQHLCKEGSLAKALRVAGITVFSHDSVRAYKAAQVTKFEGDRMWGLRMIRVAGIALALGIAAIIAHNSGSNAMVNIISQFIGYSAAVALVISFAGFMFLAVTEKKAEWKLMTLKDYKSPVPGFALATAKEIHQRAPGAVFYIDELLVSAVPHDPFLVVGGDGEQYYVEVWNEPGYEQSRKA